MFPPHCYIPVCTTIIIIIIIIKCPTQNDKPGYIHRTGHISRPLLKLFKCLQILWGHFSKKKKKITEIESDNALENHRMPFEITNSAPRRVM